MFRTKKLFICVVAALVLTMGFFTIAAYAEKEKKAGVYNWKVPTGSTTGTYFPALSAICQVFSKYTENIKATASAGGGSASNARKVGTGEAPFSLSTSSTTFYAYKGTRMFQEKYEKLMAWGTLHRLYATFLVKADSSIESFSDLKGKKVAIGEPGSGDAVAAEDILQAAGIWDDIIKVEVGDPQSLELLKMGKADAAIHHTSAPNPNFFAFSTTTPIRALDIPEDVRTKLVNLGYFAKDRIEAQTYKGMSEAANVVTLPVVLIIVKDIPEDVVYEMTKTLWDHFDEVVEGAPYLKEVKPERTLEGIPVVLHPGAYKYYKEKGFEIPTNLKP